MRAHAGLIIIITDAVVKRGGRGKREWQTMGMALYSLLLVAVLVVGAPWWLARMVRYRAGMGQRLGRVPAELRAAAAGRQVVWVHAVSVGEVLAATRLVAELEAALGAGWVVVVSTTTATGQALARERFGAGRVFYYPLDFAWAVRAYLRVLQPKLLVLMESELWPRMLVECGRAGVPVAVVNARVSDRSYARGMRVKAVWGRVLRRVDLFLAQSEEDARRLVAMGARAEAVRAIGNLKYDVRAAKASRVAELIKRRRRDGRLWWREVRWRVRNRAPIRKRSRSVYGGMKGACRPERYWCLRRGIPSGFELADRDGFSGFESDRPSCGKRRENAVQRQHPDGRAWIRWTLCCSIRLAIWLLCMALRMWLLLAGVWCERGGHNPLEPAQFGVPVVMGPSYENFRDMVAR